VWEELARVATLHSESPVLTFVERAVCAVIGIVCLIAYFARDSMCGS
jgi:hypothetical protein